MVGVAVTVLLFLLWLLTGDLTSPLSPSPDDRTILEVIRLAFYAVAGIGGVVALTVAYRRQRIHEAAEAREDTKLFNERFAAAADQLSSDQAANRLAGVYAMAALADDWDAGRQTCVNVLCAYLRMPYDPPPFREEREAAEPGRYRSAIEERLVRQTVTDVIGERLRAEPIEGRTWHWCEFDFTGATLDGGEFQEVTFKSRVSFVYARFPAGAVDFTGAVFEKALNFRSATIDGGWVFFRRVEFHDSTMFAETTVSDGGINFRAAQFRGRTWFFRARFIGGRVRFNTDTVYGGAEFQGGRVDFADAHFSGSKVTFDGALLGTAELDFRSVADWSHPPALGLRGSEMQGKLRLPEPDVPRQEQRRTGLES